MKQYVNDFAWSAACERLRTSGGVAALLAALLAVGCDYAPVPPSAAVVVSTPPVNAESESVQTSQALRFPSISTRAKLAKAATFDEITPVAASETLGAPQKAKLLGLQEPQAVFSQPPSDKYAALATSTSRDAATLVREAETLNNNGLQLLARGALFSARAEFSSALKSAAAASDARATPADDANCVTAVDAAMRALAEVEDFLPGGKAAHSAEERTMVIRGHHSGAVPEAAAASLSAADLRQAYYLFAFDKLSGAVAGQPCGSVALHGLGKTFTTIDSTRQSGVVDARGKAEVCLRAALQADGQNFMAANDLGVLLAEDGRLEMARTVLQVALRVSPQPATWNNLAAVHDRLGERQHAAAARHEAHKLLAAQSRAPGGQVLPTHNVQWVDQSRFAAAARPQVDEPLRGPTQVSAARPGMQDPATTQPAVAPVIETVRQPRRNSILN
jgi:tetratricopeptide (TPR) repeat protein